MLLPLAQCQLPLASDSSQRWHVGEEAPQEVRPHTLVEEARRPCRAGSSEAKAKCQPHPVSVKSL